MAEKSSSLRGWGRVFDFLTPITVVVLIVFSIGYFATWLPDDLFGLLPEGMRLPFGGQIEELGERGDYLNYLIGIPIAAAGALVAAIIAYAANRTAHNQYDLQFADFADRKVHERYGDLVDAVNALDEVLIKARHLAYHFGDLDRWGRHNGVALEDLFDGTEDAFPPDAPGVQASPADGPKARPSRVPAPDWFPAWVDHANVLLSQISSEVKRASDALLALHTSSFWTVAMREQVDRQSRWNDPLAFLAMSANSTDAEEARQLFTVLGTTRITRELSEVLTLSDARRAFQFGTPNFVDRKDSTADFSDHELFGLLFAGALLEISARSDGAQGRSMRPLEAAKQADGKPFALYNWGAAALGSLFNAFPDRDSIRAALETLFPDLLEGGGGADRYFREIPDKLHLASDGLREIVAAITEHPALVTATCDVVEASPGESAKRTEYEITAGRVPSPVARTPAKPATEGATSVIVQNAARSSYAREVPAAVQQKGRTRNRRSRPPILRLARSGSAR